MFRIGAVIGGIMPGRIPGPGGRAPGGAAIGVIPPGPLLSSVMGVVSGAEKMRGASSPHSGQGASVGAVPSGRVSSNTPSRSHR